MARATNDGAKRCTRPLNSPPRPGRLRRQPHPVPPSRARVPRLSDRVGEPTGALADLWPRFGGPLDPRRPIGGMDTQPQGASVAPGTATITSLTATSARLAVTATASYEPGIGRVAFVLVDLTGDPPANAVDRKDVEYAKPPRQVAEAWDSSLELAPERPYRVFFHVYDGTGVNLVAYDRRDFTRESTEGGVTC
jgi:hypothetical protein